MPSLETLMAFAAATLLFAYMPGPARSHLFAWDAGALLYAELPGASALLPATYAAAYRRSFGIDVSHVS